MNQKDQADSWWAYSSQKVLSILKTDPTKGLSQTEASNRQNIYGFNELPEGKRISILKLIFSQFSSMIIWLLIGALIVAAFLGEWIDAIAIGTIVLLNAALGFFQEYRAERSLEALQKLARPMAKVIRDGKIYTLAAKEIVPGDLLVLEEGDNVVADGRVIQAIHLAAQEASLTGESLPVDKIEESIPEEESEISSKKNMAFMGTSITHGRGKIVVTETGKKTELGKIAALLGKEKKEELTPLQKKLNRLGSRLTWMCLAIVIIVFGAGMLRGSPFIESLLIAISLAVAAIPEGLPAVVTIALALGVRKMVEAKALVRRLPSVETLGCTTVICTDKTGTLTRNEMMVSKIWVDDQLIGLSGQGYIPDGTFKKDKSGINPEEEKDLLWALTIATLCNNAQLYQEGNEWKIHGDPTEAALLVAAQKAKLNKSELEKEFILKNEFPFDSHRKFMSVFREKQGEFFLFVKGALDVILEHSNQLLLNGNVIALENETRQKIHAANLNLTNQALRVLAVAYRPLNQETSDQNFLESQLIFVGLIAMLDPPRSEVKEAIALCHQTGIHIVMITGDDPNTAVAIGKSLNLIQPDQSLVTGRELEQMDEDTLKNKVRNIAIYARTSAPLKHKIIQAWKQEGEIVAMTGDGVNDAPAIKEADIGLSMGLKGTDVAREASDMVILDDNFATIVSAIREGRGIYDNILKFVNYLISCNLAELLIIFISLIFNFKDPKGNPFVALTAVQLLWLNLITDGLPAIALSIDPVDPKVMHRPPRNPKAPILSLKLFFHLFSISITIAIGALIGCLYGLKTSASLGYTMTLTILVTLELVRVQMVRAQYNMKFMSNPFILLALGSSLLLQLVVIYTPFLQPAFNTVALGLKEWLIIATIAIGVFVLSLGINWLFKAKRAS